MNRVAAPILLLLVACACTTTDTSSSSSGGISSSSGSIAVSSSTAASSATLSSSRVNSSSGAGSSAGGSSSAAASSSSRGASSLTGSSSTSGSTSSAGSSSGGAVCGGGAYDSYWDNACGAGADTVVSCQTPGGTCQQSGQVCGCDGVTHASECAAQQAGVDLDDRGGCPAPVDRFRCGARFCAVGQYCIHTGDITGIPDNFVCANLPAGCAGTADCECVRYAQCGEQSMLGPTGTCVAVSGGVINRCPDARFY